MKKMVTDLKEMRALRQSAEWATKSVGLVPTMGALHAGHIALLERARAENERVVLTIFVNPTQFNDPNDLANYPRTIESDVAMAEAHVDAVWVPQAEEMYRDRYRYRVTESELSRRWEGVHRPGHFDGVLTVVLKLLNAVQPTRAYFGEKDWQQLQLVRGMVDAFLLPIEIVACPTVRDADGLALSSRNRRLSQLGRAHATEFPRALRNARDAASAAANLKVHGFEVDYVEDYDGVRLGAVRIDGVRLIDNAPLRGETPNPNSSNAK